MESIFEDLAIIAISKKDTILKRFEKIALVYIEIMKKKFKIQNFS